MVPETASAAGPSEFRVHVEPQVALPEPRVTMEQDEEWCVVQIDNKWRQIRFHDYEAMFSVPGLYEKVIYDLLSCRSPQVVTELLDEAMDSADEQGRTLRVLDLGAGNGMVGELLAESRAEQVVGIDIIEAAAEATERDRPGIYDDYHIVDLTRLTAAQQQALAKRRFNCLTCVAALGFGDIAPEAFKVAYDLVQPGGWIAFNIKETFLDRRDPSGFADLIHSLVAGGDLNIVVRRRYRHRLGTDRRPIHYVAVVGRKRSA